MRDLDIQPQSISRIGAFFKFNSYEIQSHVETLFICGKPQIIPKSVGTNHAKEEKWNDDIGIIMSQPRRQQEGANRGSGKQTDNRILFR